MASNTKLLADQVNSAAFEVPTPGTVEQITTQAKGFAPMTQETFGSRMKGTKPSSKKTIPRPGGDGIRGN